MGKGDPNARGNQFLTIPEDIQGSLNPNLKATLALDVSTDGNGFRNLERFRGHQPDGFNSLTGSQLVGNEGEVSGNFMPHYATLPLRLDAICNPRTTTVLGDGRIKHVWKLPEPFEGPIDRKTFSAYYGMSNMAVELLYGKIRAMSIESTRGGDVSGNITFHFNGVRRNASLPGFTKRSEVKRVELSRATGSVQLLIPSTPLGAGGTLTIAPGALQSAVTTAVVAIAAIGSGGNILVTGSSTASGAGTSVATTTSRASSSAGAGSTPGNAFDVSALTFWTTNLLPASLTYDFVAATTIASYKINFQDDDFDPASWNVFGSNNGLQWDLIDTQSAFLPGVAGLAEFQIATPSAYRYLKLEVSETAGPTDEVRIYELRYLTNTSGTGFYEFRFRGALANMDIRDWSISNGAKGWKSLTLVDGTDGKGADIPKGPYLESTHALVYKAASYADLATIDMGDATTPAPKDDSHLIKDSQAHRWGADNLVNAEWFEDRSVNPGGHSDGEAACTMSVTVPKTVDGSCEEIYATENIDGDTGVEQFYIRQAYRAGQRELWIDMWCGRDDQPDYPVENGVSQRQFPLKKFYNVDGSLIFTIIEPAAA